MKPIPTKHPSRRSHGHLFCRACGNGFCDDHKINPRGVQYCPVCYACTWMLVPANIEHLNDMPENQRPLLSYIVKRLARNLSFIGRIDHGYTVH